MGFLQSWNAVNIYIDALARYGIDNKRMSSDLCGRICKYTCDAIAKQPERFPNNLDFMIRRSAALVAMCALGPEEFRRFRHERHDISEETVAMAAAAFRLGGRYATALELRIIHAVADAGACCPSFTRLFCQRLAESCLEPSKPLG